MAGRFVMLQRKLQELKEQMPFDDITERIEVLEKLRAAEAVDSLQQPQYADELRDFDAKFARLKAAFDNDDDTQSRCSDCNQSRGHRRAYFSDKKLSEKDRKEAAEEEEAAAGRRWSEIVKYCGAYGSGMIVGALFMLLHLLSFSEWLFPEEEAFLMPPT